MDCTECTQHVRQAIAPLSGVESVNVLLATEKAVVQYDPARVDLAAIRTAVEAAGYSVPAHGVRRLAGNASGLQTIEVPVKGMDCTECTQHVQKAIAALPGVETVDVLLSAERAVVQLDPARVDLRAIRDAVAEARVPRSRCSG